MLNAKCCVEFYIAVLSVVMLSVVLLNVVTPDTVEIAIVLVEASSSSGSVAVVHHDGHPLAVGQDELVLPVRSSKL